MNLTLKQVLNPEFMSQYTSFENLNEFFAAVGITTVEGLHTFQKEKNG